MMRVRLPDLLREASDLAHAEATTRGIAIVVVAVDEEAHISRSQVLVVIGALLHNAVRAAPSGGRVSLTAQSVERELVVAIYGSGGRAATYRLDEHVGTAAVAVGGRISLHERADDGIALFAFPLGSEDLAGCEPIDDGLSW